MNHQPIIEVRKLEKHYGPVQAVRGLELNVGPGQIYGFLGPNGAGKTTTIRMLLGLIRPSGGEVRLFGQPLARHRAEVLAKIGALVESPSAYGHLTGRENLEVTRRMLSAPRRDIPRLLELVGLSKAADRPVRGYSLGMKGRLGLATALLGDPKLLILDEPTNGLDPAGIHEVRELIRDLAAEGITVMVSSHLLAEVEQVATHVGIIAEGKLRFEGTLEELQRLAQPRITLEVDQPSEVLRLLRASYPDTRLEGRQLTVPAPQGDAAKLNRRLLEAGFEVIRFEPAKASLEALFMELTSAPAPALTTQRRPVHA